MSGNGGLSNGNGHSSSATKKRTRDEERSSSTSKPVRHSTITIDDESNSAVTPSSSSSSSSSSALVDDDPSTPHLPNTSSSGITSEYRVWKKNSPYLYDIIISAELEWPSLTTQFLPDRHTPAGKDYAVQRLLLGTQTDGKEGNYVMIAEVKLPTDDAVIDAAEFSRQESDHEKVGDATAIVSTEREPGGYGGRSGKLDIVQRIPHPSEVNRARYMPHNPDVIVTRGVDAQLFVFDRTRYASKPVEGEGWRCDVVLEGHQQEGYGMGWSVVDEGRLVSCASDGRICVWDINAKAEPSVGQTKAEKGERKAAVRPTLRYASAHAAGINDVAWHWMHPHLFASGADDAAIKCWDTRQPAIASSATHTLLCHAGAVNSVAFSPLSPYLLASASDDHIVAVWDVRASPASPLHRLRHHHDSVMQVLWSPFDADVVGSVSADRRVNLYDVSRGAEDAGEKAGEGEDDVRLLFQHGGHTDKVGEMSWNGVEGEEWMVASVSDDNIVQVWQPAENLLGEDDEDDEDEDEAVEEQVKKSKTG